jgi:Insertion element 4 transposase N-terminal/Transposase DDE domain
MDRGLFREMPSADEGAFDRLRKSINPEWIDAALAATGTATLRRRRLPAEQVIWLVLGMALYRRHPIDDLVGRLDLVLPGSGRASVAKSAVAQARARLGDEPLKWLFERCSETWGHASARRHEWRGLALYGVDGSTVRVPDSQANRDYFGGPTGARGVSGYPIARMVTLMALRSHLIVAAAFGPYGDERPYCDSLWSKLPDDSVAIVDRNFLAARILVPIAATGRNRHWLTRAKSTSKWDVVEKLGRGDELVEVDVRHEARTQDPSLPRRWQMRAIAYKRRGFRPQVLLTSMLDAKKYPAAELIALYHERWEIELGYGEVKTDMLERIAEEADLPPSRISFMASLRMIRDEWLWAAVSRSPGAIPKQLQRLRDDVLRFVLPPRRTDRLYPRLVKIKMSNYDRKLPTTTRKRPRK